MTRPYNVAEYSIPINNLIERYFHFDSSARNRQYLFKDIMLLALVIRVTGEASIRESEAMAAVIVALQWPENQIIIASMLMNHYLCGIRFIVPPTS